MPLTPASEKPTRVKSCVGNLFWNKLLARIIVTFVPVPERVDALPSPNLYFPHGASGAAVHQDQGSTCEARGAGTTGDGGEGEVAFAGEDRPDRGPRADPGQGAGQGREAHEGNEAREDGEGRHAGDAG